MGKGKRVAVGIGERRRASPMRRSGEEGLVSEGRQWMVSWS